VKDPSATRVAFVTGAASGIGRAAASAFVGRGYATVLADVDEAAGLAAQAELADAGTCSFVRCDVTDDDSVRQAIAHAVDTHGRLDAAFNAAGIDGEHGKATADCTMENWNRVLAVDLTGTFSCMRHELPAIVASGGGAAAKHAVVGLTKAAAVEYARAGVRVNAICPGTVDTPMFRASMPDDLVARLVRTNPVGRLAEASEIADIALWLCDDGPGFLTGQAIVVDGGASA
jgi:NAD(P)-dependent dehydrogenase (short-subunit alcohol dehydrogenase family)